MDSPRVGMPHSYGSLFCGLKDRGEISPAIHIASATSATPVRAAVTANSALFVIPKMDNSVI